MFKAPAVPQELKDLREGLAAKQSELATIMRESKTSDPAVFDLAKASALKSLPDDAARVARLTEMNGEASDIFEKAAPLEASYAAIVAAARNADASEQLKNHPGHIDPDAAPARKDDRGTGVQRGFKRLAGEVSEDNPEFKTFGELVAAHELKNKKDRDIEFDVGADMVKTLFETGNGWAPETTRGPRFVELPQSVLGAIDLIPVTTTDSTAITYMQEIAFSDNVAVETAEGGSFPEATLEVEEATSVVRKIPVFIPVTDEQLEDIPQAGGYINNRLGLMLQRRLSRQVLLGDGVAPNLEGILEATGVKTQAVGADDIQDAAHKGMTKVNKVGDVQCSAFIANSTTWESIYLQRTADGIYIWGHPSVAGPRTLWGLPTATDEGLADAQIVTGDFRTYAEIAVKRGITIKVSDSHSDYFVKGKQAIRADMRAAFVNYRPGAFCDISD